jgi:hypothetical protein
MVLKDNPDFQRNKNFKRDMVNIAVGIIWQLSLAVMPVYFVIKEFKLMFMTMAVTAVTSVFLKFNWYNKLEKD